MLDELAAAGRKRYGAAVGGVPASTVDLRERVALVLGNEAHGLSERVLEHVDGLISIPMAGAAESLNVAMAGTLLAFGPRAERHRADRWGVARPVGEDAGPIILDGRRLL